MAYVHKKNVPKTCPFCGKPPNAGPSRQHMSGDGQGVKKVKQTWYSIMCMNPKCEVSPSLLSPVDMREAVAIWNNRY